MAENKIIANNGSSIVLYSTDGDNIQLEVKLEKDSVWLNREQIAQLYGRDYKIIAKHINNALREELEGGQCPHIPGSMGTDRTQDCRSSPCRSQQGIRRELPESRIPSVSDGLY